MGREAVSTKIQIWEGEMPEKHDLAEAKDVIEDLVPHLVDTMIVEVDESCEHGFIVTFTDSDESSLNSIAAWILEHHNFDYATPSWCETTTPETKAILYVGWDA
jgi:hypothetical protein